MGEIQIRVVNMVASDLNSFLRLQKQTTRSHGNLSPKQIEEREHWMEFPFGFNYKDTFFIFAERDGQTIGCLYGFIATLPTAYETKKVGFLDLMIVDEAVQDQGVSKALRDNFFDWLREQRVTICKLTLEDDNPSMRKYCEEWGFQNEETQLKKDISQ